jgi:adenosylcobyric acid synthase
MNPVLLKPEGETGAQLILRGKRVGSFSARDYFSTRQRLLPDVLAGFRELGQSADLVLVEGAGSASEVNLRQGDIANFGFARAADVPVILLGDIDRGGVIASLVGTFAVIDPADAALVVATLVNKFRGDVSLFAEGRALIEAKTDRPCLGPVPFFAEAHRLPAEDVLALDAPQNRGGNFVIAVPRLSRIANFDDLDPLRAEPGVDVRIVPAGAPLPREARLVILPGSKATRADLEFLRAQGWDTDIAAHLRAGGAVLGICGGYQMLGRSIADPKGLEGVPGVTAGLGLLDVTTTLEESKQLKLTDAVHLASGEKLNGYHMHLGITDGPDRGNPFAEIEGVPEGAVASSGRVMGTYLHGLFAADGFRRAFLESLGATPDPALAFDSEIDAILDRLAAHLETHLDLDFLLDLAREPAV